MLCIGGKPFLALLVFVSIPAFSAASPNSGDDAGAEKPEDGIRRVVIEGRAGSGVTSGTARDARRLIDGVRDLLSREKLLEDE
mgnify:CR=1 FL=1